MRCAIAFFLLFLSSIPPGLTASTPAPAARARALRAWGALPLAFEENRGQFPAHIPFAARGRFYSVLVEPTALRVRLRTSSQATHDLVFRFEGAASPLPAATGLNPVAGKVHYFNGTAAAGAPVRQFERLRLPNIRPGVDLLLYGNGEALEYDFELAPGADPASLVLNIEGSAPLRLDASGDLLLTTPAGTLRHKRPLV